MDKKNTYSHLLDELIDKNRPFAAWFFPNRDVPEILIGDLNDVTYLKEFNKLNGQEGFVFAPFRVTKDAPIVLLKPGNLLKGYDSILSFDADSLEIISEETASRDLYFVDHKSYLTDVELAIKEIKSTKLAKVILSRLIDVQRKEESIGKLFLELQKQTPNAYVYLVNLPQVGTWMGATPEVLLKSHGSTMETVSLAGTQSRREDLDYSWHTKEIEEQAFVSRYMLDIFYRFDVHPYTTQGPDTMESGKVAHLKTSFMFPTKKIANKLGDFIADLHPTPAVCGLPKLNADKFITKTEKHNRRYYTGYLGPWRLNDSVRLFVNLRCMEIIPEKYILYSGGGITSKSVPQEEWEETNYKAKTLLSAIEAVQNK